MTRVSRTTKFRAAQAVALLSVVAVFAAAAFACGSNSDGSAPKSVATTARTDGKASGSIIFEVTGKGLFVAPATGGVARGLSNDTYAHLHGSASGIDTAPSPDGAYTAVVERRAEGVFLVLERGDGPSRPVAQLAGPDDPPLVEGKTLAREVDGIPLVIAWSPDSKTLAYGSIMGEPWSLTVVDVATIGLGTEKYYEVAGGYVGELAWSPDGRTLAISTYTVGRRQHSVLMLDFAGHAQPVRVLDGCHITWSPDSRFVAVHRDPGAEGGAWVLSPDGATRWMLSGEEQAYPLSWQS